MKSHRKARVSEVIREVASETVLFHVKDPRVKGVTVTRAEVSGDLQHAKVYVSVMGSQRDQVMCLRGLQQAAGFIQSKLADRMKSRFVPIITFVEDVGVKNSIEVNRLIREALALSPEAAPATDAEATELESDAIEDEEDEENEEMEDDEDSPEEPAPGIDAGKSDGRVADSSGPKPA